MIPENEEIIAKEKEWFGLAEKLDWKSYDPMDFLQSPYLAGVQNISSYAARFLVQTGIRSGTSIRRLLRIEPHEEAKALSDFLSAAVILYKGQQDWVKDYISKLDIRLRKKAIVTSHGCGWGLEFPYSTRFGNVPARTPLIYQTTNALLAFLDVYEMNKDEETLRYISNGIKFILEELGDFAFQGHKWFRYFPGRSHPVINIQASLAGLLARYGSITGNNFLLNISDQVADTVISVQLPEGGWSYSADQRANFIDGFHTGFILQGMAEYIKYRNPVLSTQVTAVVQKGFEFFRKHLLTSEGLPRYYADGPVKRDGQNFAQCIQTLVLCATKADHIKMAFKVWGNMIRILRLESAQENCNQKKLFTRDYPQLRWTIGPAVLATAHLIVTDYSDDSISKIV